MTAPNDISNSKANEGRDRFRRYVVNAAITGEWIPWAEFADRAWFDLVKSAPVSAATLRQAKAWAQKQYAEWGESYLEGLCASVTPPWALPEMSAAWLVEMRLEDYAQMDDSISAWRACRELVLNELSALGLTATIERTDESVAIASHEADVAGLVRFHIPGDSEAKAPPEFTGGIRRDYIARMATAHGFVPHGGLPRSIRGFCGQFEQGHSKPAWMDHTMTWIDPHGNPVLTAEPYAFDPLEVAKDVSVLPLLLEGPYSGVWNDSTTLLVMRWDPDSPTLPSENRPAVEWNSQIGSWVNVNA